MKPGDTCTFESHTYADELTGRTVKRITPTDCWSHHQYFYLNMWTPEGRSVLVSSNRDDGVYRHYLLDVESGQGLCLTETERLRAFFGELARDGSSMLYGAGRELRELDLASLAERVIYTVPREWGGNGVYYSATADHTRVILTQMHSEDAIRAKEGWDAFPAQFEAKPRCRLVEVDAATGAGTVIHEDRCWIGHPNYRPDGRTVMFCHEGPWERVDSRVWFIDPEGSNLRQGRGRDPACPPGEGTGELWGHEYWLADSSRAAYIYFPSRYGEHASIRLLDPETLVEEVLMEVSSYSHFISNRDNTMIVADGQPPLADAIFLVDVAKRAESVLCRHGSSMKPWIDPRTGSPSTQEAHPHPCFSPDGKRVVYTSDLHGKPAVYVVEV